MNAHRKRRHFGAATRVAAWLSALLIIATPFYPPAAEAGATDSTITGPIPATVTPGDT